MDKIFVDKEDVVADIIDKVVNSPVSDVTLVIPKNSKFEESVNNFKLLAMQAEASGQNIVIESVDEDVLALAKAADIKASHPLFEKNDRESSFSDIVSPAERRGRRFPRANEAIMEEDPPEDELSEENDFKIPPEGTTTKRRVSRGIPTYAWWILGVIVAVLFIGWTLSTFFSKATVVLRFDKDAWEYEGAFSAMVTANTVDGLQNIVPAQLFSENKTVTQFFPASGRATVEESAKGVITIYNEFSSAPQTLVATTRFEAPDGRIYRIDDQVIVPGAEITDGKITPASIKANATADEAGERYNTGPVDRLTIPGFEGSPRFDGFYGQIETGMRGGFRGERAVPTEPDIVAGKERVEEILRSAFSATFLNTIPEDFAVLDDATRFTLGDMTVDRSTNEEGRFSVLGKASFEAIAFREADLIKALEERVHVARPDDTFWEIETSVEDIDANFEDKEMDFRVVADGLVGSDFEIQELAQSLAGQKESDARDMILTIRGLTDAKISLWPSWAGKFPSSESRITVIAE